MVAFIKFLVAPQLNLKYFKLFFLLELSAFGRGGVGAPERLLWIGESTNYAR